MIYLKIQFNLHFIKVSNLFFRITKGEEKTIKTLPTVHGGFHWDHARIRIDDYSICTSGSAFEIGFKANGGSFAIDDLAFSSGCKFNDDDDDNMSSAVVAGIIIGFVAVVAIPVIVIFIFRYR